MTTSRLAGFRPRSVWLVCTIALAVLVLGGLRYKWPLVHASTGLTNPLDFQRVKRLDRVADAIPIADKAKKPFQFSRKAEEFPKDLDWLNTSGPIRLKDLRGKFVLLDFWTYCCINCMHILPELKKLEQAYPNELVVIGVHSAKFEGEKDTDNIAGAILRYEIEHPVVNDPEHEIWESFGVQSWPTIVLIDPEGNEVGQHSGEFKAELVDEVLKKALPYYRENKLISDTPLHFSQLSTKQKDTPLRYPGKVMADEAGQRLFIADSNYNRIVVSDFDGKLLNVYGSGEVGKADGDGAKASFNHPQGMALHESTLYVADTENHLLRKIDLATGKVSTVAGTGEQAREPFPGFIRFRESGELERPFGKPKTTALNSPWDLWIHGKNLYIAMAGPHQIWRMPLDEKEIGVHAGNGREDIIDGALFQRNPFSSGNSSFAQPSGLTSDGTWLYVADSEGSSIRAVPIDTKKEVRTVIGTAHLRGGRLFAFGDVDGPAERAKLQHCLGVAYHDGKIYVADTYNNKIKAVDAKTGATTTLVGTGKSGSKDDPAEFDEPAGISYADGRLYVADTNSHLIRVIDLSTKSVSTLTIQGLSRPAAPKSDKKPSFASAAKEKVPPAKVKLVDGQVRLDVTLELPDDHKINVDFPVHYWLEADGATGPLDRTALGKKSLENPAGSFSITIPAKGQGQDTLTVSMPYYYCAEGASGVCKVGAVVFTIPITVSADAESDRVTLNHKVPSG